ncbi:Xanthine phosphoribosyltransferase 1 [Lunasporangiospora selenospora]|uniref:Xanthine phosphoribosyltransferase 1 n=1 Tax=Lunasporangiospora selenospora TaxID=979761 RepID=A0A9P6FQP4_9FUNG|nr:Xanthine phosphoribosyltransferase 1 [Lunasporangiospora selenospora]
MRATARFRLWYLTARQSSGVSAKNLCLSLLVIFAALNLLIYLNYATIIIPIVGSGLGDSPDNSETQLQLESSSFTRPSRHPFPSEPEWSSGWFATQSLSPGLNASVGQNLTIDIVYTWVNGSDAKLQQTRKDYESVSPFFQNYKNIVAASSPRLLVWKRNENCQEGNSSCSDETSEPKPQHTQMQKRQLRRVRDAAVVQADPTISRYRDMDELQFSVRSVAQYATSMTKRIHILSTKPDASSTKGQVPNWLDLETSKDIVNVVHHDMFFENKSSLPTFNSLAIESQLHHIPSLSDVFLYLNDDVFLGRKMSPSDVWTPLYGFVLFMEPSLLVSPNVLAFSGDSLVVGEWYALQWSNYLLSKHFGARHRSYVAHMPHVLSVPMLQEMENLWPEAYAATSSHRFRGEGQGLDVHTSFFMAHYVIERLRETQLSSFWLYRLDENQDGILDWGERERFIQRIQNWNDLVKNRTSTEGSNRPVNPNFVPFVQGYKDRLQSLGYEPTDTTTYKLSGLDGFPFLLTNGNTSKPIESHNEDKERQPYSKEHTTQLRHCQLDVDFCLGPLFTNSSVPTLDMGTSTDIFERLAFAEFHCGDCLLHMLRQTSKDEGLASEILPQDPNSAGFKQVTADLAKYNYVVASAPSSFVQLWTEEGSKKDLASILEHKDTLGFFCINDNVVNNPDLENRVHNVFKTFLEDRFPDPSPWEKSVL